MDRADFDAFTAAVRAALTDDDRVLGLVALGSTAAVDRQPDEWSDHDLWIVTRDGAAPRMRDDTSWLPRADRIAVRLTETEHGRTVVDDDGHVVEYAVFDDGELEVARANAYRVLLDRGDLTSRMAAIASHTDRDRLAVTADDLAGRFVVALVVGLGRWARGERLSASDLVRGRAVRALLELFAATTSTAAELDRLDPTRRVELVAPALADEIETAVRRTVPEAATSLIATAERHITTVAWPPRLAPVRAVLARVGRDGADAGLDRGIDHGVDHAIDLGGGPIDGTPPSPAP